MPGPVLLHVVTQKGHGFQPAAADPVYFHTPAPFKCDDEGAVLAFQKASSRAYTDVASEAIHRQMAANQRVTVMTAAMCQGTKLEPVRAAFPERFFDTGICESHTVAFAAGQAKAGLRPIVDIYSTFLQRSFDQIFQEVALQNLPVTFLLDRAGLVGADGPTHHGIFDLGYLRLFPNMVVAAPGDEWDLAAMLEFALGHDSPVAIRYPKANAEKLARRAGPHRAGPGRGHPVGRRRHDPGRRSAGAGGGGSGRATARRGTGRRRGQCPVRQTVRRRRGSASVGNEPVRRHRRGSGAGRRIRQRGLRGGEPTPA